MTLSCGHYTASRIGIEGRKSSHRAWRATSAWQSSAQVWAGSRAACALRQHGIEATVYERAAQLGEVGAGIQLGPNAVKVLRALGIEPALRPLSSEPTNYVSLGLE